MKGIVLAGGTGSRLWPLTLGTSKQLLPVYDKPLIYYPIATLMSSGIREISIITTFEESGQFKRLLGKGDQFGVEFSYFVQEKPLGIAQAFLILENEIRNQKCALVLGDNIFNGLELESKRTQLENMIGAHIFAYQVSNPEQYGVVEFDSELKVKSIEEKPNNPKSNFAIPGLYFYDEKVVEITRSIKPSARGELEISSVNQIYLNLGELHTSILPRGTAWLDTGTFTSLHDAGSYVRAIEDRQGLKLACLEEIAFQMGWIDESKLKLHASKYSGSSYGKYLKLVLEERI